MTVCANCGESNAVEAEFCGSCGTFLEWQGKPAEEPVLTPTQGPAVEQPALQQPAEQRAQRRSAPTVTELRPPSPGDLICGECGVGNAPDRKFCRHCGHSLAEAQVVRPRWWQRLLPRRGKRKRRIGARPTASGGRPWRTATRFVSRLLLIILAVGALFYAAVPSFRGGVNHQATSVKNWVTGIFSTRYTPVRPTRVTANAEVPDHSAGLAADNARNTFWAAPVPGPEPVLTLTFDHAVDIRRAIIRTGNLADFESAHRPTKLHLVYSTGKTFDVTLADTPDAQTVDIGESAGATTVEIHIVDLHRSLNGSTVALSEIELFEKS
jgi:ribosomal protein L40E